MRDYRDYPNPAQHAAAPIGQPVEPEMNPNDQPAPGIPVDGENVCSRCGGSGQRDDGQPCDHCGGTGRVIEGGGGV